MSYRELNRLVEPPSRTMYIPMKQFGDWNTMVLDYTTYLNARKSRKWLLDNRDKNFYIKFSCEESEILREMFFLPPQLKYDEYHGVVYPSIINMDFFYDGPELPALTINIRMSVEVTTKEGKVKAARDSEVFPGPPI